MRTLPLSSLRVNEQLRPTQYCSTPALRTTATLNAPASVLAWWTKPNGSFMSRDLDVFDHDKALAFYGSEDMLQEVVRQYLGDSVNMLWRLRMSVERVDRDEIRSTSHWFRSGLAFLFAAASVQACRELERLTREESPLPLFGPALLSVEDQLHRLHQVLSLPKSGKQ